jgi:hypothetical protein
MSSYCACEAFYVSREAMVAIKLLLSLASGGDPFQAI